MKRIFLLVLAVIMITVMGFVGCDDSPKITGLETFVLTTQDKDAENVVERMFTRELGVAGDSEQDKVYFRSSDIEFWALEDPLAASDICSYKNVAGTDENGIPIPDVEIPEDDPRNVSVQLTLEDIEDTFIFIPGSIAQYEPEDYPQFDYTKNYNIIRIDAGGGDVRYIDDGQEINVKYYSEDDEQYYDAVIPTNSIVLVDSNLVNFTEPILLRNVNYDQSGFDEALLNAFGGDANDPDLIFLSDLLGNEYKSEGCKVDFSGGIIMPFDSIDFTDYQFEEIGTVEIVFEWDMADAWSYDSVNDRYTADDRISGLPFDFNVTVNISPTVLN